MKAVPTSYTDPRAHELRAEYLATYCRSRDLAQDADRALEREANVFGAELLMPEAAVREAWAAVGDAAEVAGRFEVSAHHLRVCRHAEKSRDAAKAAVAPGRMREDVGGETSSWARPVVRVRVTGGGNRGCCRG